MKSSTDRVASSVWAGAIAIALIAMVAGCERATPKVERAPAVATRPPPPDAVVATVSAASLTAVHAGAQAFVGAVKPGAGAMIQLAQLSSALASAAGAASIDGLDLAAPVHLVVVEMPAPAAVVVGKVADAATLEAAKGAAHLAVRDGWALLGPEAAVRAVEGWARAELVARPVAPGVVADLYVDRLVTRHAAQISAWRGQMTAAMATAAGPSDAGAQFIRDYFDGLAAVGADIERLRMTLTLDGRAAEVDLALGARTGSRLAQLAAAQRPSDFALLGRLPAGAAAQIAMAGRVALGPYREALLAMTSRMMVTTAGNSELIAGFRELADLATGELAAGVKLPGMAMTQVIEVGDATAAERVARRIVIASAGGQTIKSMGIEIEQTGLVDLGRHQGAVIHGLRSMIDLETVPAEQRKAMAAVYGDSGQLMRAGFPEGAIVVAIGNGGPTIEQAIDAYRGKAPRLQLAGHAALLDAARSRRDSLVMLFDLASFAGVIRQMAAPGAPSAATPAAAGSAGFLFGLGGERDTLRLHITLLADQAAALISANQP